MHVQVILEPAKWVVAITINSPAKAIELIHFKLSFPDIDFMKSNNLFSIGRKFWWYINLSS